MRSSSLFTIAFLFLAGCGDESTSVQPCSCPAGSDASVDVLKDSPAPLETSLPESEAQVDSPPADTIESSLPETSGPETSASKLRFMSFNIKHGAVSSLEAIAKVILAEEADIVGLQEVDVDADRSDNVDQPHRLGQLTGMASLFRTAITLSDGGLYGLAVLSRYPIIISERIELKSTSEQRILAIVNIDYKGTTIPFCVTHLGLSESERATQATEILAALKGKTHLVLVGDMNATPEESSMKSLAGTLQDSWAAVGQGDGFTIPADTPTKRIDYIWLSSDWTPLQAQVPNTEASDHRPVVVSVSAGD